MQEAGESAPPGEAPASTAEPIASAAADELTRPVRGLWVLAEGARRVLDDARRVPPFIEDARALGATDLFVQVYRGGRAWYTSDLADDAPFRAALEAGGEDALALLLERAHAAGMRVHAWVNVLSLSRNRSPPIVQALGRSAVLVDRRGRSMLDYPEMEIPSPDRGWYRMGTRGIYLDASAPGVRERLVQTFEELLVRYPTVDGLHLDYIRHPGVLPFVPGSRFGVGLEFGYGAASIARFQADTGLDGPWRDPGSPATSGLINANRWDAWRRDQVTELVREIHRAGKARLPRLLISAAVNSYVDRAYLSLAQDWKRWLEEGLIDVAVPMIYTRDDRLFRYQVESFVGLPTGARIWPGVGVWLFAREPARANAQLKVVRASGAPGVVLFSYDSIAEAPALMAALSVGADEASGAIAP